jgi:hypothetical protein
MVRTVRGASERNDYSAHPPSLVDTLNCPTNNSQFPTLPFPFLYLL